MTNVNKIALAFLGVLLIVGFGCVFFGNNNPPSNQTNNTSMCPTQVSPVCGSDGRNYDNECLARRAGTSVAYSGSCRIETCSETDNGKDSLVKGTATVGSVGKTDSCADSMNVLEYFCSGNSILNSTMRCPDGMMCQDGSCVRNTQNTSGSNLCNDSDNGLSYFVSGRVIQNGTTYSDECSGSTTIREYSCRNGTVISTSYDCPTNYVCTSGRCVERNICSDTDGTNENVRGSVTTTSTSGTTTTLDDYCSDGSTVVEYTCSGSSSTSTRVSCTGGRVCRDGACRTNACEDSDGGRDYYTTGSVSRGSATSDDRCVSSSGLVEYYCRDGNIQSETVSCPGGYTCTNGRCVGSGGVTCSDTDGGINYNTRGVARTSDGGSGTDTCSGSTLTEYYCDGNTRRSVTYTVLSSERCENGAVVSTSPSSDCSNPDGMSTTTATTVTHTGESPGSDSCLDSSTVVEFYCNSAGNIQADPVACGAGMMCDAGRCVPSSVTYTCTDPDGSDLTRQTTAIERSSTGIENSATDGCDGTSAVWEASCFEDRTTFNRYDCPSGTSCTDGACTGGISMSCSDSDGGRDYISGGRVTLGSGGIGTDSCSGNTLIEYYCDGTSLASETHDCGAGYVCTPSTSGAYCKATCTDNDAWVGGDPMVQSTSGSYATYADTTYYDICVDSTHIIEQSCTSPTSAPIQTTVDCSGLGLSCYGSVLDGGARCST